MQYDTTNDIFAIIDNMDFLKLVPIGASDDVITVCGMLNIIMLANKKNKEVLVPNNVVLAYAKVRSKFTSVDHGYIGEFWASACGVNDGSITYKEHELKGAELINKLDNLLAEKLREANKLH